MGKIREVAGTVMLDDGWVDLEKWTGRPRSHIPKSIREPSDVITHVDSLMAIVGDSACDPRSGGIAGAGHIAEHFGVGATYFRRKILPNLEWVRYIRDIPVTNVNSADYGGQQHQMAVTRKRCDHLGITPRA